MADYTDYGIAVSYSTTGASFITVGGGKKIDPPSIKQAEVETTSHGSGGVKTFIPGKLIEIGELKMDVAYNKDSTSASMIQATTSGSNLIWKIVFPNTEQFLFSGFVKELKPKGSDSNKPDQSVLELTIRCSGSLTLS